MRPLTSGEAWGVFLYPSIPQWPFDQGVRARDRGLKLWLMLVKVTMSEPEISDS